MPWHATLKGIPWPAQPQTRSKDGPTIRIRCPSFLRQRYASISRQYSSLITHHSSLVTRHSSLLYRPIPFPNHAQALQREIGIHVLDQRNFRRDHIGESAGRYADRLLAKLLLHPANQSVDQPDVSVIETGLHRADSASADHLARLSHVDARQAGRALKQRVGGNLHAGTNH